MIADVPIIGPNAASAFAPQRVTRIVSVPTSEVRCDHCARTVLELKGNVITITLRHGSDYHKTAISLEALGLTWAK